MIALASNWEDRLWPPNCDKKEDPQVWATSFPHLLTPTQKEKKLNPKAMITYKRPITIGQKLTNYKDLALNKTRKQSNGGSRPCEHCALCGCYGKNNKSLLLCTEDDNSCYRNVCKMSVVSFALAVVFIITNPWYQMFHNC